MQENRRRGMVPSAARPLHPADTCLMLGAEVFLRHIQALPDALTATRTCRYLTSFKGSDGQARISPWQRAEPS